uniref:Uncharacterized protein n=1 Tax=Magallana gigas TaxID=29159 RepID=K1R9C5_MAGGI
MLEPSDSIPESCFFTNEVDIGSATKSLSPVSIGEFSSSFTGDWSDSALLPVGDLSLIGDNLSIFDADDTLHPAIFPPPEPLVEEATLAPLPPAVCLALVEVLVRVEELLESLGLEVPLVFP